MMVLEIDDLQVRFGPVEAVRGLDLAVEDGEIFGLLGPNGAGKTSTLAAIEGLVPPAAGTVKVAGIDARRRPRAVKAQLGVQLQSGSFQNDLGLLELARLYAALYGVPAPAAAARAALVEAGLEGASARTVERLSSGQRQRFALSVALMHHPALLLLDEPTTGLDPQARRALWARIEDVRGQGGSVLLTTHSMEEAAAVCDRIAILDHGSVLALGTPSGLVGAWRDDPAVQAVAHGPVTLEDVFIGLTGSGVQA